MSPDEAYRFSQFVSTDENGCWIWQGYIAPTGYAKFNYKLDGRAMNGLAYRLSFEHFIGPISEGYEVNHKCGVRSCVNPMHLEALSKIDNIKFSIGHQKTCGKCGSKGHNRRTCA